MSISESPTQEWTLASAQRGMPVDVLAIGSAAAVQLLVHGIRPGARVIVEGDAPFGGPCIVRVGRARVAIDRRLANAIVVTSSTGDDAGTGS